jgi:hypothetical protein
MHILTEKTAAGATFRDGEILTFPNIAKLRHIEPKFNQIEPLP